jgi:hypothetical protein
MSLAAAQRHPEAPRFCAGMTAADRGSAVTYARERHVWEKVI